MAGMALTAFRKDAEHGVEKKGKKGERKARANTIRNFTDGLFAINSPGGGKKCAQLWKMKAPFCTQARGQRILSWAGPAEEANSH